MTEQSQTLKITTLDQPVRIETDSGEFQLTINQVKNFVAKGSTNITTTEAFQFLQLCRFNNLNPWVGDAFLIKYKDQATMVTSKYAYMKRAERAKERYEGFKAGIILEPTEPDGDPIYQEGSLARGRKIIGGWAEVYVRGRKFPVRAEVDFEEYVGLKSDGSMNKMWKSKPATMIRKVPLCAALREAFPDLYGGMVSEDEITLEAEYGGPVVDAEIIDKEPAPETKDDEGETTESDDETNDKPKRRQRRQEHEHRGQTIKTNGIRGPQLETIEDIENKYPEAVKIIDGFLKECHAAELTFLTESEGKNLMSQLMATLGSPKTEGEDKKEEEPDGEKPVEEKADDQGQSQDNLFDDKGKINCPDRGEIEIETSFCKDQCPKSSDKTCIHYKN